jgi:hypothetical protein
MPFLITDFGLLFLESITEAIEKYGPLPSSSLGLYIMENDIGKPPKRCVYPWSTPEEMETCPGDLEIPESGNPHLFGVFHLYICGRARKVPHGAKYAHPLLYISRFRKNSDACWDISMNHVTVCGQVH